VTANDAGDESLARKPSRDRAAGGVAGADNESGSLLGHAASRV